MHSALVTLCGILRVISLKQDINQFEMGKDPFQVIEFKQFDFLSGMLFN